MAKSSQSSTSNYTEHTSNKKTNRIEGIDKATIIAEDFNIFLSKTDKTTRQKI